MSDTTHPLLRDHWSVVDEPEHSTVRTHHLNDIHRTVAAIDAIARLVGNSVLEPDATSTMPLPTYTMNKLLGGVECLCTFLSNTLEDMGETAQMFRRIQQDKGAGE
jgi:hypothetical protein